MKIHSCFEQVDAALAEHNARLDLKLMFNFKTGEQCPPAMEIPLKKLNSKKRGKLPSLFATFCPICGERLAEESKDGDE